MTPNCHEVETIHASQNDTSLRKWGVRPYDYDGNDITNQQDKATLVDIKGQTLKWNQIAELGNTDTTGGITVTNNSDGSLTINGTATREVNSFPIKSPWINNHIYMWLGIPTGVRIYNQLYKNGSWVINLDYRSNPLIRKITSSADANRLFSSQLIASGTSFNNVTYFPMEFDLTQMFGETKAEEILAMETAQSGSGIAYFKSLFPLDYYPYNSGSLIPFMGNGIKTVGFNQWDEQTQAGYWNAQTGTYNPYQGQLCSVNPIRVFPNTRYCFCKPQSLGDVIFFDINNNLISSIINLASNYVFTTPSNCYYIKTNLGSRYGDTYNNNICINISDTSKNGTYEPYTESLLNLPISTYFPSGMKQVGNYDELTPSKATTRIGEVTFNGSENWSYDSNNALFKCAVTNAVITNATTQYNVYTKNNRFDDKSWATRSDGSLGMYYGASFIFIKSTQFADVNALKTWLQSNPITVYYELATPIETAISPELDLTFNIDKGGTEELLPSSLMNGSVDLGSLTWTYESGWRAFKSMIADAKRVTSSLDANWFCSRYRLKGSHYSGDTSADMSIDINSISHADGVITIRDTSFNGDATAFKNSLQGVYLWYGTTDSTPTTTPLNATIQYPAETKDVYFTYHVSDFLSTVFKFYLVTKGIQIPCELEDDTLIADCTSEISNEPGFFDCKIKAENDLGQIFSNKFQLHIERSPQ